MTVPLIQGIDPGEARGFALTNPNDLRERRFGQRLGRILRVARTPVAMNGSAGLTYREGDADFWYTVRNVVEGQWWSPKGAPPNSLCILAFRAGYVLAHVGGGQRLAVDVWKNALFRGGGNMSKRVFGNRLAAMVLPDEEAFIPRARSAKSGVGSAAQCFDPDCVDAIGISWAASLVSGRQCDINNLLENVT